MADSEMKLLKKQRSVAKGLVTRTLKGVESIRLDVEHLPQVMEISEKVGKYFDQFLACHNRYHSALVDLDEIRKSNEYCDRVICLMRAFRADISAWVDYAEQMAIDATRSESVVSVQPQDSVSNVGSGRSAKSMKSGSSKTRSSTSSRLSYALMEAATSRAMYEAEAVLLQERQALAKKELELTQEKEALELKTKVAKARAKEKAYQDHSLVKPVDVQDVRVRDESWKSSLNPDIPPFRPRMPSLMCHSTPTQESPVTREVKFTDGPVFRQPTSSRPAGSDGACHQHQDGCQLSEVSNITTTESDTHHNSRPNDTYQVKEACSPGSQDVSLALSTLPDALLRVLDQGQKQQQLLLDTLQLPKVDLMTFDGDPSKYWMFIRAFEHSVDKHTLDDSVKLSRLLRFCTGKARRVIESCAVKEPAAGYKLARSLLKDRFGNDFVVSQTWVDKITNRKPIRASDPEALRDLADDLRNCVETLTSMGRLDRLNENSLVQIIERLPLYLQNKWKGAAYKIRQEARSPSIQDMLWFVSKAADEANDPVFGKCGLKDAKDDTKKPKDFRTRSSGKFGPASFGTQVDDDKKGNRSCPMCHEAHLLYLCSKFKAMKPQERMSVVRQERVCLNCLTPGHFVARCTRTMTCGVSGCTLKHNRLLHIDKPPKPKPPEIGAKKVEDAVKKPEGTSSSSHVTGAGRTHVMLPVVPVRVRGHDGGKFVETYALLDSGSTTTFCSESIVRELALTGTMSTMELTTLENDRKPVTTFEYKLEVTDPHEKETIALPKVFTRPTLNINQGVVVPKDLEDWGHLQDLDLPVVDSHRIELLIGQDVPEALIPLEVKRGEIGAPYAIRTALGWTLNGPIDSHNQCHMVNVTTTVSDLGLQKQVEKLWKLENVGGDDQGMSVNDRKVISLWDKSIQHKDGHYVLPIPFKATDPSLPDNLIMAKRRLEHLGRRLQKDLDLHRKYTAEIDLLLEKGYAEEVPRDEISRRDGGVWYLPHHPVLNPKKPEKTRIVFDCAARFRETSLNDRVLQGPDLTNKLVGVLIKFRQEHVAFMADIEAMFHQVEVVKNDRDTLRFLWFEDGDISKDPKVYRMTRHLFGGVWSPSCANYALKRTARDNEAHFSLEAKETVEQCHYVDDCLKSVPAEAGGIKLAHEVCKLLAKGGFRLTKWISNSRELLKTLPAAELGKGVRNLDLDKDGLPTERALGMLWDVSEDTFRPSISIQDRPPTKRGVLSILSSVYDPLGLVSPYVLLAKIIFQDLCRSSIGWDDNMPDSHLEQWRRWCDDLRKLERFKVPRCLKSEGLGPLVHNTLHHFSDASERGLGAVTYLRTEAADGEVHCALVMAKAKLAPIKATTIPRLELAAAVESVKLDKVIRKELEIPIHASVFWTDSMIVLHYIANEEKRFQTFVANRVAKIHESSSPSQWRHVDTDTNPGDDVSRGLAADELITNKRWLYGPSFLWLPECDWPQTPAINIQEDDSFKLEEKVQTKVYATDKLEGASAKGDVIKRLIERHSSWSKLKKSVAWILRAKTMLRNKARNRQHNGVGVVPIESGSIKIPELRRAEIEIVKFAQRGMNQDTKARSNPIRKLKPMKDENGVVCVGGRLNNAMLSYRAKHQMILPKRLHVVELIISHYHKITGHSGIERVLTEIRQRFWIVKGRAAVRRVNLRCTHCRKCNAKPMKQQMADLPSDRVNPPKAPFTYVGLDYFGPFQVKMGRGRKRAKRYGCIFTCLTSRAIHLEVAGSLDTDSFINALQRFISRRGRPERIRSDNGTNFVGGRKELKQALAEWNLQHIESYMQQQDIDWTFNPPAASHMGGSWERMIRSVRKVMSGILKEQVPSEDGLTTLMCEVEAIINGRPITRLSDDPEDLEPLTPNHLLLLRRGPTLPPGLFVKDDLYSKRRWRHVQYLANLFWKRWTKEYLPSLQERQKWLQDERNVKIDDIVLIVDNNMPRNAWSLGRVIEVYPGKDNRVRAVKVRTQHTQLVRPVNKLCLIEPVEDTDEVENRIK
ncbi:uncharacterized protein LOC135492633 [Lineus longissimus]|uniref:uncharacterized protein LOC135492633 n=1 Tax=Lineus longissimus TaxID=88925 RepID=UPI00315CF794